jgi:hypothetical protein
MYVVTLFYRKLDWSKCKCTIHFECGGNKVKGRTEKKFLKTFPMRSTKSNMSAISYFLSNPSLQNHCVPSNITFMRKTNNNPTTPSPHIVIYCVTRASTLVNAFIFV